MRVAVGPSRLQGKIAAPASKSVAHRALICSALASGASEVFPLAPSQDIQATAQALQAMGASIRWEDTVIRVTGIRACPEQAQMDCKESGSTLRFLIPVAAALGICASFTGSGRLPERPLGPYRTAFIEKGVSLDSNFLPLHLHGRLQPGCYTLPGDISSQFITGLLFALPLLDGDSRIQLSTPLESAPYVALTIDVLRQCGIVVHWTDNTIQIPGRQQYQPRQWKVEADYSNAAFFLVAGALGNDVKLINLPDHSLQGDQDILRILDLFGAAPVRKDGAVWFQQRICRPVQIDAKNIPDLVPILCVAAAAAPGKTVITGTKRLKIKESDRAGAMVDCLTRLGADIRQEPDALTICGGRPLHGAVVSSYSDHRIAMSMAIASCLADSPVVIEQAQAVEKSYPRFFEDFKALGGIVHVV